jgi:hypothetical protein
MESKWISARVRTFDPQAQLAGSAANSATALRDPHTLQMKSVMQPHCGTEKTRG